MMYDDGQSREFGEPLEDDAAPIWRYVSLPMLLQMLQTRTLFFPSIATLAKTDPWEGHWYSDEAPIVRSGIMNKMEKDLALSPESEGEGKRTPLETIDFPANIQALIAKSVYVNCWHRNSGESAAMWAIYGRKHGIAIQSSIGLLKSALAVEERPVAIVRVQYGSSLGMADPSIGIALRKRNSFSHEQEIRAMVVVEPSNEVGIPVKVDLNILIEQLYLWPLAPPWMLEVLKAEVRLHDLHNPIKKSPLYDPA
jgi:hypothetical protein